MHGGTSTVRLVVRSVPPSSPALGPVWQRLQEQGGVTTPFLTWEWFSAIAETPVLARETVVLVAYRDGTAVGLLPVEVVREGPVRTVRCTGAATLGADHLDVVALPEDQEAVAEALAQHVARQLWWDLADFEGLVEGGALARALLRALTWPLVVPRRPVPEVVPVVELQGSGSPDTLARLRRRAARGTRSAERSGGGFSAVGDPGQVGPLLESLMELHNSRFGNRSGIFATPQMRDFHVRAATRMSAAGLARVCRLYTAERDIALEYVLLLGDRAFAYQSGFLPGGGHSPGRTVECRSMLTAAEEGRVEYDLLRGDEAYKAEYATTSRSDVRVRALRPTPRTAAWFAGRVLHRLATVAAVRRGERDARN